MSFRNLKQTIQPRLESMSDKKVKGEETCREKNNTNMDLSNQLLIRKLFPVKTAL